MSRALVRTLRGGGEGTLAVPLALAPAARIQERDWEDFLEDPTQLANGIRDLVDAAAPAGVPVSHDHVLLEQALATGSLVSGPHATAAVESARRLRQSFGDRLALLAVMPGPACLSERTGIDGARAGEWLLELGKLFLTAGVDVLLVRDDGVHEVALGTLANVARFHQALAVSAGQASGGLPVAATVPLAHPFHASGVVVTDEHIARDVDFTVIEDWIEVVG